MCSPKAPLVQTLGQGAGNKRCRCRQASFWSRGGTVTGNRSELALH